MIPRDGDQNITLEFKGLHIHITYIEDHQISYAKITKLPPPDPEDPDEA